jgi:hypothetical protein
MLWAVLNKNKKNICPHLWQDIIKRVIQVNEMLLMNTPLIDGELKWVISLKSGLSKCTKKQTEMSYLPLYLVYGSLGYGV